jgi:phosphoenolpyruvate---glycerone phosphotransferase subunit DhaL
MVSFSNSQGRKVVLAQVQTIIENKAYLSEVDGKIGDGDHGINMAKGFNLIKDRLGDKEVSLSEGLGLIGKTLMTEIGGSMGPLYGTFFIQMSLKSKDKPQTDARLFGEMLKAARDGLEDVGEQKSVIRLSWTLLFQRRKLIRQLSMQGRPSGGARKDDRGRRQRERFHD